LDSRIASRVLWQVATGTYQSEQDLYERAREVPWAKWFSHRSTIKVKVSAQDRALKSLEFITLRIKDAVCDAFRATSGQRPTVETQRPDVQIVAFLDGTAVTLYLDTSGDPLFKRGHRIAGGAAPLRENLAAGILRLAGWPEATTFLDPLCGSGTILIEAAEMAAGLSPGRARRFAFERLSWFEPRVWRDVRAEQRVRAVIEQVPGIFGSDVQGAAVEVARANLKSAGVERLVRLERSDVLTRSRPADEGILVTNPPYGVRVAADQDMTVWYPKLGDALKQRFPGWRAYLLTADLRLPKLIGLTPARRIPLFNGPLECRLYEFELVEGSMRGRLKKRPGAADRSGGSRPART
jgi:putative N6-adenine-specific DNA methylase